MTRQRVLEYGAALCLCGLFIGWCANLPPAHAGMGNSDPLSLGKVTVASAGTPVFIKSGAFMAKGVTIQSDPANTGTYMTVKDQNGNIMAKLTKGQSFTPPQSSAIGLDLHSVQLDTDTNGDGCYVSYF